jgi:hypothetical protein
LKDIIKRVKRVITKLHY